MNPALKRDEVSAGLLAAAVHGFFVLLLVVGVSWQIHDPQPVMADIWQSLPAPAEPARVTQPSPPPLPQQQTRRPPVPDNKAADIALEKKKREEKLLKQKQEADKRRREEARRLELELQREAAEKEKRLAEARRRDALKRDEEALQRRMLEESLAADTSQIRAKTAAAQRASEIDKMVARYQDKISAKIRSKTRLPENLTGNPQVEFKLIVLPSGDVAKITLTKSSGNAAYDEAVRLGIDKSSPLPLPPDMAAAARFRDLDIKHKARE